MQNASRPPSEQLTPWGWLTILFFLGSILRSYNFWRSPLWVDEYVTWWIVSADDWLGVIRRSEQIAGQSSLYNLLVKAFTSSLGEGPLQLRLPSVLLGSTTLLLVYPLGMRLLKDRRAALTSVLVFALSEPLIFYSQNARPYALALFLTLLSFLGFLDASEKKEPWPMIRYIAATTLLIYSHLVFSLVALVQIAYLMLSLTLREMFSRKWLLPLFFIVILCLPVAHRFLNLYTMRHQLDWISHIDGSNLASEYILALLTICHPLVFIPTSGAVIATGFGRDAALRLIERKHVKLLLLWLTVPVALFTLTPLLLGFSFFHNRYFLLAYPAAFFLLASFFSRWRAKGMRQWLPLLVFTATSFGFVLVPALVRSNSFSFGTQWDWAGAARVLARDGKRADLVVFRTGLIEADFFASDSPPPHLECYVGWPILAHLPHQNSFKLLSLPFHLHERTQAYWLSVQKLAGSHSRFWVIGEGRLTESFVELMLAQHGFHRVHHSSHQRVQVTLLERVP